MRRDPAFAKHLRTVVDRLHWKAGKHKCSSGFNISAYKGHGAWDSLNTQLCEQLNVMVSKYSSSLSYRCFPTFKCTLAFALMQRNRQVKRGWL
jgi:hypothetical protein